MPAILPADGIHPSRTHEHLMDQRVSEGWVMLADQIAGRHAMQFVVASGRRGSNAFSIPIAHERSKR